MNEMKARLSDYKVVDTTIKKGPRAGEAIKVTVGFFSDLKKGGVARIIPNPQIAETYKQSQAEVGKIVEAKVEPYQIPDGKGGFLKNNLTGKDTFDRKWVVQFDGESLESAIRAHGKKSAGALANAPAVSADVAV